MDRGISRSSPLLQSETSYKVFKSLPQVISIDEILVSPKRFELSDKGIPYPKITPDSSRR